MTFSDGRNNQGLLTKALVLVVATITALTMAGCSGASEKAEGGLPAQPEESNIRFYNYNVASARSGFDTVIDDETGVVYLRWRSGSGSNAVGGITPLLDDKGEPTIVANREEAIANRKEAEKTGEDRFRKYDINKQGVDSFIDTETGVVYIRWRSGSGKNAVGGITPLIGENGKATIDMGYVERLAD